MSGKKKPQKKNTKPAIRRKTDWPERLKLVAEIGKILLNLLEIIKELL